MEAVKCFFGFHNWTNHATILTIVDGKQKKRMASICSKCKKARIQ